MQNTAKRINSQSTNFTEDFNLSHRINLILSDNNLSAQADRLLIRLVNASGRGGFCYPTIETLCSWVKLRPTQVRLYLRELETKKYIRIFEHVGHANEYQIVDIIPNINRPLRFSEARKELLRTRKRYTGENVVDFSPQKPPKQNPEIMPKPPAPVQHDRPETVIEPPARPDTDNPPPRSKPIRFDLVKRILDLTRDHRSFGMWVKFVRTAPIETVYMAIHSLEVALSCDQVSSPGRYLTGIIRNVYPELFNSRQTVSRRPDNPPPPPPRKEPEQPTVERDPKLNRQKLKEIMTLLQSKQSPTFRTHRTFGKNKNVNKKPSVIESDGFYQISSSMEAETHKIAQNRLELL